MYCRCGGDLLQMWRQHIADMEVTDILQMDCQKYSAKTILTTERESYQLHSKKHSLNHSLNEQQNQEGKE